MKFTVTEAVNLAHKKFKSGSKFTLPDIYDTWAAQDFSKGGRGLFGIAFDRYINKANCGIKRIGAADNGDALYLIV